MLDVHLYAWAATLGGLVLLLAFDQWVARRHGEHEISVGEAVR